MLCIFSKFTSNLTSQKQIVSKLEFPTLMGALLSGIQLPNCLHGNTLAVFHFFFFPTQKFLSYGEFKYIAQQAGGVLGSLFGQRTMQNVRIV